MEQKFPSVSQLRDQTVRALREAFAHQRPDIAIDESGYLETFHQNLLPGVATEDFESDLRAGDGNELDTKFRAVHSSSALAVNCFGPFRTRLADLQMPHTETIDHLQFERKCPTGLRGGRAPNLDVLLSGSNGIVAIESKLTEYLGRHRTEFSPAYAEQICDERREQAYFQEMLHLERNPGRYAWLDAAQLIKHAFGLAHTFRDTPVTLLYLYWEPGNPTCNPIFGEHRKEISAFGSRVAKSSPRFAALSYAELWSRWRVAAPNWLSQHLDNLEARYRVLV
jgi:hypothetical protein